MWPEIERTKCRSASRSRLRARGPAPVDLHGAAPWTLDGGKADQRALQIVATPFGKQPRAFLVLHPFGDGLQSEPPGEIDQGVHERAIVTGVRQVLHERAVDLQNVDTELAQIA